MAQLLLVVQIGPVVALSGQKLGQSVHHGGRRVIDDHVEDNGGRVDDKLEPDVDSDEDAGGSHGHYNGEGIVLRADDLCKTDTLAYDHELPIKSRAASGGQLTQANAQLCESARLMSTLR